MNQSNNILPVIIIMFIGAAARLIPHMPNFTPFESVTIFGAAYLSRKNLAFIVPLVLMYLSDFIINNTTSRIYFTEHEGIVWFSTYMVYNAVAMILIVLASRVVLSQVNVGRIAGSALIGAVIFYLVSNFGVWAGSSGFYQKDISGLMTSYVAGIPFFRTSLIANLLFSGILFGSYSLLTTLAGRYQTAK